MMKVLALQRVSHVAADALSLSVEARMTETLDFLSDKGMLTFAAIAENHERVDSALEWADALTLSKHSSPAAVAVARRARERGVRIVYDVDDWIFSFPSYSNATKVAKQLDGIRELMSLADVVTVANQNLLDHIGEYCARPILMPNGMYVEKYIAENHAGAVRELQPPRIVFTNADLIKVNNSKAVLLRVLQDFFHQHPDYLLDFYGDPFPEIFSLPFLHYTSRKQYPDYVQALIAGGYVFSITPLGGAEDPDSLFFNSCKNPFKYLNYGTARVPGIYSRSPIYEDCVKDGETGLLVDNTYESWLDAMERMAADASLRNRIRGDAFDDVCRSHHISRSAEILLALLGNG
ncbi:glycosyltransferase family 1 protein [Cupriavidus sp. WKF15]|uniref:glycosyltransferase n=1 Tax=Cupriavidus sp. WKF15 TaxID=3032282 RepID=UPI0023E10958|nr:glycosyltransferase [Cupriavidus sp. WKF15]WER45181.1 glycosyltransferase family 1 protein [Cupriavidus sp. WKF15]